MGKDLFVIIRSYTELAKAMQYIYSTVIAKETLLGSGIEALPAALLLLYSLAAYSTKKGSLTATYLVV